MILLLSSAYLSVFFVLFWKWEDRALLTVPSSLKPWEALSVKPPTKTDRTRTEQERERERNRKKERSNCPLQAVFRVTPKT